ncbi:MAG: InlB B-repeat-containing protein [Bacteroidales bacterium]|nr:InlB B-repeat-containing protein [Bacteroidales bacterium]
MKHKSTQTNSKKSKLSKVVLLLTMLCIAPFIAKADPHTVTFHVHDTNVQSTEMGTIIARLDGWSGTSIASGDQVESGRTIVFLADAAPGFEVSGWFVNGVPQMGQITGSHWLDNLTSDVVVTVEFEELTHTVTFNVFNGIGGSLIATVNDVEIQSGASVRDGSDIVFTATADPGFRVRGWRDGMFSIQDTDTVFTLFDIFRNSTIQVEFEEDLHEGYFLASSIAAYGDGETLNAVFDLATMTVTVTAEQPVTNATPLMGQWGTLNIPENITVRWAASFSTDQNTGFDPLITLGSSGTFEVVEGGFIASTGANSGATISAFGATDLAIIINGGTVKSGENNEAIQLFGGSNTSVAIKGGKVLAQNRLAIITTGSVTVSGGVVFAYGESIYDVISIGFAGDVTIDAEDVTGNGIVIAWNKPNEEAIYEQGSSTDLISLPADRAVWDIHNGNHGIRYTNNGNQGFIVLPVTVDGIEIITHTVTFNSQGGSNVTDQTVDHGGTLERPTDPTRTGFTFEGWYTDTTYTTAWFFATSVVTSDTTLFARWEVITHTITFNSQGGSNVTNQTVDHGETVERPTDPTRTGFTFEGWYTSTDYTTAWVFATSLVTSDTTLFARWTADATSIMGTHGDTPLQVWVTNGILHIEGLTIGTPYRIYTLAGIPVHQGISTTDIVRVENRRTARGVYIIRSENHSVKIVW